MSTTERFNMVANCPNRLFLVGVHVCKRLCPLAYAALRERRLSLMTRRTGKANSPVASTRRTEVPVNQRQMISASSPASTLGGTSVVDTSTV